MEEVKKDDNLKLVQERIECDPTARRILLKAQESELQCENATLQTKVDEFDQLLQRGKEGNLLNHTFRDSTEKLHSAKRELAAKLRSTLSLKRLLEYVPSQAELIQYELRFSELYTHIQAKHRQTHKYYATYNILLEIKELMLKETSLLNSISSQFKGALTSPAGRKKLIDSMEGILHGTQQDNLRRRGISLCSRCHLCGREEETNSHLFLHCSVTVQVWNIFIALTGIQWVMPNNTMEMLSCWNKGRRSVSDKKRWGMIPACIWWTLWNERNSRCFEDNANSIQKIKMNCLLLFHFWCKLDFIEDSEAIIDVLGSL